MSKPLCQTSEVTETGREFRIPGGKNPGYLMIFRRGEQLFAYHNVCPHENRNLNLAPDRFQIDEAGLLICAHHGAAFELDGGKCLKGPCQGKSLQACAISVREGVVWLD